MFCVGVVALCADVGYSNIRRSKQLSFSGLGSVFFILFLVET